MTLDLDGDPCELEAATSTTLSPNVGVSPFASWFGLGACRAPEWRGGGRDVARSRGLVPWAWAALAAMRLAEGQARIESMDSGFDARVLDAVDLERLLLRATAAALDDDAETAGGLVDDALKAHDGAAGHPATALLLRLGHWKSPSLDTFRDRRDRVARAQPRHQLNVSGSRPVPPSRRARLVASAFDRSGLTSTSSAAPLSGRRTDVSPT